MFTIAIEIAYQGNMSVFDSDNPECRLPPSDTLDLGAEYVDQWQEIFRPFATWSQAFEQNQVSPSALFVLRKQSIENPPQQPPDRFVGQVLGLEMAFQH